MKEKFRKVLKAVLLSMAFAMLLPSVSGISGQNGLGTVEAASPKLNKKKATIKLNKTVKLKVSSATKKVKWTSSNTSVAVIQKTSGKKSQTAVIKGTGKGTATITAKVGTKKLKAKIKVNHTHTYLPATCTAPATCSGCGATYGPALGHSWTMGTCVTPATCSRCGATGSYGGHSYSSYVCQYCHGLQLEELLDLSFDKGSGDFVTLSYYNYSNHDFTTQNFVLYPENSSSTHYGLTIASDDGSDTYALWVFGAYSYEIDGRLNIPVSLTSWLTPRLEFDLFCEVPWTTATSTTYEDQIYHIVIVGNGTDMGKTTKTYSYTRTQ